MPLNLEGLPFLKAHPLEVESPGRRWLIESLWARRAVGLLGGPPKSCKSWLGLDMALSVASGHSLSGTLPGPGAGGGSGLPGRRPPGRRAFPHRVSVPPPRPEDLQTRSVRHYSFGPASGSGAGSATPGRHFVRSASPPAGARSPGPAPSSGRKQCRRPGPSAGLFTTHAAPPSDRHCARPPCRQKAATLRWTEPERKLRSARLRRLQPLSVPAPAGLDP